MTSFTPFADFTHDSVPLVPAVKGTLVALYATGSSAIQETAADIAKYRHAGAGVVLIDQSPSLSVFAAGLADVADVENFAGTPQAAAKAVTHRQLHGWQSTLYVSFNSLAGLQSAIASPAGVLYGVADYSWSQAQSEQLLGQHPDWAYCQYGDPGSNPRTLIPGTSVTLQQCNADIDVAQASWAAQFLPKPPPPPPPPHGPYLQLADGTKSLADIAASRNTSEQHLRALAETAYPVELARRPLRKGMPYFTSNP